MSIPNLPVNFKDDILNTEVNQKRKYQQTFNSDGSVSLDDVTTYTQQGSEFGALQVNQTNKAINNIYDERILTLEEAALVTETGFFVDAQVIAELSSKIPEEDNGYLKFVDGTLIQWGSNMTSNTNAVKVINLQIPFINNSYFVTYQFTRNANTVTRSWIGDAGGNEARTEDNFGIYIQRSSGTSLVYISWAAIGRWK